MSVDTSLPESPANAGPKGPTAPEVAVPDDGRYEVVDGQIVEKTVGAQQVGIAFRLAHRLESFAEPNRSGHAYVEMLFRIDQAQNLQRCPDAAFVSDARWPFRRRVPDVPAWDLVPDLALEVVSPSNTFREVLKKVHEYFQAGVRQVWVVHPDESEIYVYSSTKQVQILQLGDELDGGELLPGFRLPLAALFEDEPEAE